MVKGSTKSFWDMEIEALNNSLLSLVTDKWVFTFRNTDDDLMPYTDQIAVFSFETHTIQKFIDISFKFMEWRSGIPSKLHPRDLPKSVTARHLLFQATEAW